MESIDALNRGMIKFPGVLIFSSRDHQIVQTTANRIMEIINGKLIDKITTYDEYLESDEMARKRFVFSVEEKTKTKNSYRAVLKETRRGSKGTALCVPLLLSR